MSEIDLEDFEALADATRFGADAIAEDGRRKNRGTKGLVKTQTRATNRARQSSNTLLVRLDPHRPDAKLRRFSWESEP